MDIAFYSLGAAEEVTGSKHVIEVDGRSYLIDCGAFQGSRAEADRKNRDFGIAVDRIDVVIVTHGHYDHCGLLPLLAKRGYGGNISDYIVLESTYGDRRHDTTDNAMERLGEIAKRAVKNKGKILIPAFAIERTQELVYYFHMLVDAGVIPEIPIYVDSPMATNATTIFQVHPECYDEEIHEAFIKHHKNPFGFNSLHFTTSVEESKALNDHPGPLIIISADGMCEAGRIQHHLIHNIGDPNTTILTVGYMAQNTLGRRIRNKEPEVKIHGQWLKRRAEVEEINAFSAHADYVEAVEWLDSLDTSGLRRILLVHGEPKAQAAFKKYLAEKGYPNTEIVQYGKTYSMAGI
jgi:metallo-beta-lactamase family protein